MKNNITKELIEKVCLNTQTNEEIYKNNLEEIQSVYLIL
jgi:hypothetical protein